MEIMQLKNFSLRKVEYKINVEIWLRALVKELKVINKKSVPISRDTLYSVMQSDGNSSYGDVVL